MPLAHTCSNCGRNLAGIPAPLDPHYRLPIVVCPACRVAVVRWSDGHRPLPRAVARARTAVVLAVSNTLWFLLAAAAFTMTSYSLAVELRRTNLGIWSLLGMLARVRERGIDFDHWVGRDGPTLLVTWFCVAALTGAYLAGALGHVRRPRLVAAFALLVGLFLVLPDTVQIFLDLLYRSHQVAFDAGLLGRYRECAWTLPVLLAAAVVAPIGIPIGRRARRIVGAVLAASRRRLRARIRKARLGP
jgi:hypothetical protein